MAGVKKQMKTDVVPDVVIAGGGINGAVLALGLARIGLAVVVVDKGATGKTSGKTEPDGRAYALNLGVQRMLTVFGLWDDLQAHAEPILDMKISDAKGGIRGDANGAGISPFYLHFNRAMMEGEALGFLIEDAPLRGVLSKAVDKHPLITVLSNTQVCGHTLTNGGVEISVSPNKTIHAKLLIGCDGRDSKVAKNAGIVRIGWDYPQSALVCALRHTKPHHGTAHQIFTPNGPLAVLPLRGNRVSIVWTQERKRANLIHGLDDAGYLAILRETLGDFLGEVALDGTRGAYPLGLALTESFVRARVALVGDSAHGIHPLAGQGLNLGLFDSAALCQVLFDAVQNGEDIGAMSVLNRYQVWRRFDTCAMALATDGLNRLFSNDVPLVRGIRGLGLGAINALPFAKQGFARLGAGAGADVPRFMQGRELF